MASLTASTLDPATPAGVAFAKIAGLADVEAATAHAAELAAAIKGPDNWPAKTQTLYEVSLSVFLLLAIYFFSIEIICIHLFFFCFLLSI